MWQRCVLAVTILFGVVLAVLGPAPAYADGPSSANVPSTETMDRLRELLVRAGAETDRDRRFALADEAVVIADRLLASQVGSASTLASERPEILLLKARALSVSDPAHPEACRPN